MTQVIARPWTVERMVNVAFAAVCAIFGLVAILTRGSAGALDQVYLITVMGVSLVMFAGWYAAYAAKGVTKIGLAAMVLGVLCFAETLLHLINMSNSSSLNPMLSFQVPSFFNLYHYLFG